MNCGGAFAQEAGQRSYIESDDLGLRQRACKSIGNMAVTIMRERQKELPMSDLVERVRVSEEMGLFEGTGLTQNILMAMIAAAYRQVAFPSDERQADMVATFRNEIELLCFEGRLTTMP